MRSLGTLLSFMGALAGCGGGSVVVDAAPEDGASSADAPPSADAARLDASQDANDPWWLPPDEPYDLGLPERFPRPPQLDGQPLTRPRVELGRHLFYDVRLSGNQTQSCASCHRQRLAFTDGRALAVGSTGEVHFRSSMSLTNVAYVTSLTWASRIVGSLHQQALMPIFGEAPVELGMAGREDELVARIRAEPRYQALFPRAFPDEPDPFTVGNVTIALATFQRTLISHRSAYDRYVYDGDTAALGSQELLGLELFNSERFECFHCHGGFNFSDSTRHDGTVFEEVVFHNTALYNVDGRGSYPAHDTGLMRVTGERRDMGLFRAPTLRNIALTAPYFHDGSAATLDDALDHYDRGGRLIEEGPYAGDGSESPLRDPFVKPIGMTADERAALRAFLHALTDEAFVTDPRFSDPWAATTP
jgi:cytochrome c peroxidase